MRDRKQTRILATNPRVESALETHRLRVEELHAAAVGVVTASRKDSKAAVQRLARAVVITQYLSRI
jgi:hypothetical protein